MPRKVWQELCSKLEPCDRWDLCKVLFIPIVFWRLVAKKVTRRFRQTIDEQDNLFNTLGICFEDDKTRIFFNEKTFHYTSVGNECRITCENKKKRISGGDHRQVALQDFEKALTKVAVAKTFYVMFQTEQDRQNNFYVLTKVLSVMTSLKVRKLKWELSSKEMDTILPFFEARTLETIHTFSSFSNEQPGFMDINGKMQKLCYFQMPIFPWKLNIFFISPISTFQWTFSPKKMLLKSKM